MPVPVTSSLGGRHRVRRPVSSAQDIRRVRLSRRDLIAAIRGRLSAASIVPSTLRICVVRALACRMLLVNGMRLECDSGIRGRRLCAALENRTGPNGPGVATTRRRRLSCGKHRSGRWRNGSRSRRCRAAILLDNGMRIEGNARAWLAGGLRRLLVPLPASRAHEDLRRRLSAAKPGHGGRHERSARQSIQTCCRPVRQPDATFMTAHAITPFSAGAAGKIPDYRTLSQ